MSDIVKTEVARLSYPNIIKPRKNKKNEDEFSAVFIFTEEEVKAGALKKLKKLAEKTAKEAWPNKLPKNFRTPFRECEDKEDDDGNLPDGYEPGGIFVNAKGKRRPVVVDKQREPIDEESEIYAGCYVRAGLTCYAYGHKGEDHGNKGVAFGLRAVQKVRDGEPLGGASVNPEEFFDVVEEDDVDSHESVDSFLGV